MNWAIWSGAVVLAVAVGGLLYLRDRPLYDERGRAVDEHGHRVPNVRRRASRVVDALLSARNVPHTGPLLRRQLHMSRALFYRVVDDLTTRGLLELVVADEGSPLPWSGYRLTRRGVEVARGRTPR